MVPLFLPLQLQIILWLITLSPFSSSSHDAPPIAKPGCPDQCGEVRIPYPFGIGAGCFHDPFYEIMCKNNSFGRPKPFLKKFNLEMIEINWLGMSPNRVSPYGEEGDRQTITVRIPAINPCGSDVASGVDLRGSPYIYSTWYNILMVKGCAGSVVLKDREGQILTGCTSFCANKRIAHLSELTNCCGVGCCQASVILYSPTISEGSIKEAGRLDFYEIALDQAAPNRSDKCALAAGLITSDSGKRVAEMSSHNSSTFPVVLLWNATFLMDIKVRDNSNFSCDRLLTSGLKACQCNDRYEGNAYLPNGCQVVQGCKKCEHHCRVAHHHVNSFGQSGGYYHCVNPLLQLGPILGFSLGMGLVLLFLCSYSLYGVIKKKRETKRKAKYFERNGGLLLQQHMSSSNGAFGKTKIFRTTELEKATNNFNKNRILGQGGQGTVYKGMLTDGKIVAIKKSKLENEGQVEHFINELVILSQINHRNVVKILGCCLETEIPLLIYEFIPNGTLYHLLHAPSEDFQVTWKMRLQIAADSADAIAFLHSSSATPIYHRDIKSSNILLDEKYRAKVSDFGASRAITIEQTHVTTCVVGTYGYLDPEYFQSNQFTEKSDVYSFGVVLVELITGKKPTCPTTSGGWICLAYEFLFHMETSRLFDLLDARILDEGKEEEFIAVANLARQCLHMSGKQRPSMKEIAVVLDGIRSNKLSNLKEAHREETKRAVTETSDVHRAPSRASTFCSDNCPGCSSSIDT